jgi:hypothetical protein
MRMTLAVLATSAIVLGCSRADSSNAASAGDSTGAPAASATAASSTAGAGGDTTLRGTVTQVSDSVLTLSTPGGEVRVALVQPLKVYVRNKADLTRVADNAFVGITSVSQPDGTQRATEIHVFPEELRGMGEGSRPMGGRGRGGNGTMTNGSVAPSRMTNGSARMTNGTSSGAASGTVTVTYSGGTQTITVPKDVEVTVIEPSTEKLSPGTRVTVPATHQPDGSIRATRVMVGGGGRGRRGPQ